jgi:hypothetical protein
MKLAYPIDTMLQVEVVGGTPGGAVVAVEPAQAREAWASILGPSDGSISELDTGGTPPGSSSASRPTWRKFVRTRSFTG